MRCTTPSSPAGHDRLVPKHETGDGDDSGSETEDDGEGPADNSYWRDRKARKMLLLVRAAEPIPSAELICVSFEFSGKFPGYDFYAAPPSGGALWVTGGARPKITNCTFIDNAAERGAAFVADAGASPTFDGCVWRDSFGFALVPAFDGCGDLLGLLG